MQGGGATGPPMKPGPQLLIKHALAYTLPMAEPQEIILLVGVPAAGKTWVMDRSQANYRCVYHDDFIRKESSYLAAIIHAAHGGARPVLIESPFSMSAILQPLHDAGLDVKPVFIIEDEDVLHTRYLARGRDEEHIICGHLARQRTFQSRIGEYKAFWGTSSEVLNHLNLLAAEREKNGH